MKSFAALYGCLTIVIITLLSSCTKNTAALPVASEKTTADRSAMTPALVAAGDSTVIRGDTAYGDQTALVQSRRDPYLRDNNYINFPAYNGIVWTWDGVPGTERSFMKFNTSRIPKSVRNSPLTITKALLYLYEYQRNDGLDIYRVNQTVSNEAELRRIAGNWSSSTVTWNNQPRFASGSANPLEDVVDIPAIQTPIPFNTDNIVVDVTAMAQRMVTDSTNNGFLLKIIRENENKPYCGRSFGSFACPEKNKRPRLVFYY